jgi:hypothetical protein
MVCLGTIVGDEIFRTLKEHIAKTNKEVEIRFLDEQPALSSGRLK